MRSSTVYSTLYTLATTQQWARNYIYRTALYVLYELNSFHNCKTCNELINFLTKKVPDHYYFYIQVIAWSDGESPQDYNFCDFKFRDSIAQIQGCAP